MSPNIAAEARIQTKPKSLFKQSLDSILGKWSKGDERDDGLGRLAAQLKEIQSRLDFRQSPRGWCYTLENQNIINKGEFDRAEEAINACRRRGHLPIDFCAQDKRRKWMIDLPTPGTVENTFRLYLGAALNAANKYHTPDWWKDEKYYLQMLVEKIDLVSLFAPVCEKYHVPLANAAGWSDINERAEMAERFLDAEGKGQKCVLLYCGDFDPWGLKIESTLKKNLEELEAATGYSPDNLKIDRFGLNYRFIVRNNLTWIDNLKTSSDKDMSKSYYCYNCEIQHDDGILRCSQCQRKMYVQPQFVRDYVANYGVRKVEANTLTAAPKQGRKLAETAILKYLGHDCISRFEAKREPLKQQFAEYTRSKPELFEMLGSEVEEE